MKRLILTFIILIGVYTLLRNNIFSFPDQIIWISNHNFFFKVFLPLLMSVSALVAIFKIEKHEYFTLAGGAMMIDAIYRFSVGVNHLYGYLKYQDISPAPSAPGTVTVVTNLWPSHMMLFIEIILTMMIFRLFIGMKQSIEETSS